MMDSQKSHLSSLERPGPVGRIGRILLGVFLAWYGARFLAAWIGTIQQDGLSLDQALYTTVVQKGNLVLYALALISVFALPVATRRHRLIGAAILFVVVAGLDYLFVGDWWALPLAVVVSLTILATLAFFALAHIVAGILANEVIWGRTKLTY